MRFSDIPIDRTDIQQADLNIDNKVRSNLFAWNGQFSPQFIESLLDNYASENTTVFDPFLGSGTTLYECARQGISAFGTELNASAYFMANIYGLCNQNCIFRQKLLKLAVKLCGEGFVMCDY